MNNSDKMIDAVIGGEEPAEVVESITRGMMNAYARMSPAFRCSSKDCGLTLPRYRGRYPKLCPTCGSDIVKFTTR